MSKLSLNGKEITSVFGLLGDKENDISFSVAWALSKCHFFLKEFIKSTLGLNIDPEEVSINLQHYEKYGGITDIELSLSDRFFTIIEAKRGWSLPHRGQLTKYRKRKSFLKSKAPIKRFFVVSDCSNDYAEAYLNYRRIRGVKVEHINWKKIAIIAKKAQRKSSHAEKRLIEELLAYFRGVIHMQRMDENWVYVVSLGYGKPRNWRISYIDIVEKKRLYFHAVGVRGWPKEPPNYIAFRYYGKLQSIHHVESYEIVSNMHSRIKEIPKGDWGPHFLYKLGRPFSPNKEVRTGRIFAHGRVWCMLDTLFTSKTISQARDISKKRHQQEPL